MPDAETPLAVGDDRGRDVVAWRKEADVEHAVGRRPALRVLLDRPTALDEERAVRRVGDAERHARRRRARTAEDLEVHLHETASEPAVRHTCQFLAFLRRMEEQQVAHRDAVTHSQARAEGMVHAASSPGSVDRGQAEVVLAGRHDDRRQIRSAAGLAAWRHRQPLRRSWGRQEHVPAPVRDGERDLELGRPLELTAHVRRHEDPEAAARLRTDGVRRDADVKGSCHPPGAQCGHEGIDRRRRRRRRGEQELPARPHLGARQLDVDPDRVRLAVAVALQRFQPRARRMRRSPGGFGRMRSRRRTRP